MFWDNEINRKQLAKWIIGIVAACILIFLGIRHVSAIAMAVTWMFDLVFPLFIGCIIAMILNVPLGFIEKHLWARRAGEKQKKAKRPLAILISFFTVIGILIGVAVLVLPELLNAVTVVSTTIMNVLDQIAELENSVIMEEIPYGTYLSRIEVDWIQLRKDMDSWLEQIRATFMDRAVNSLGDVAETLMDVVVGIAFSIYILANKEKLKRQVKKLITVWLPQRFGEQIIYVSRVCANTFRLFIAGQTMEAITLGSLCTIGMLILRLPYAPMIGVLVGVTAFIPILGAYLAGFVGAFMILTVNPFKALVFLIFLVTLQQVEGNLIYPKVVGTKINLPAMWVLAAITVGGNLAGPLGMLLGVPAASAAYALLKEVTEYRARRLASGKGSTADE